MMDGTIQWAHPTWAQKQAQPAQANKELDKQPPVLAIFSAHNKTDKLQKSKLPKAIIKKTLG